MELKYPYAIFDMDGTLLDSMKYWKDLGGNYLRSKGLTPPENLRNILASLTMEEGAEYFKKEFGIEGTAEEITADIYRLIRREYEEEIEAKPGAKEFLKRLKASGVTMCVATATASCMAEPALKRLGLDSFFEFILDCSESSGKTSPVIYDQAAARLGGCRENTLVFEDAWHAAVTAHQAGYYVAVVQDDSQREKTAELRQMADCFIEDYRTQEFVWESLRKGE